MVTKALIQQRVQEYFVSGKYNCTMTVLSVLAEHFETPLSDQALASAQFLPGAGGVGGFCGLFAGGLMFLGVWADAHAMSRQSLNALRTGFVEGLRERLGSTQCSVLQARDCAELAREVLAFAIPYFQEGFAKFVL